VYDFSKGRAAYCINTLIRAATGSGVPRGLNNDLLTIQHDDFTAQHIRMSDAVQALIEAELATAGGLLSANERALLAAIYPSRVTSSPGAIIEPPRLTFTGGDYFLLVIAGQSNSGPMPTYTITDFPTGERGEQLGALGTWFVNNTGVAQSPGWRRVSPPILHTDGLAKGGCGVACVRQLLATYPRVALIHYTIGGTTLAGNWGPGQGVRGDAEKFVSNNLASFPHPITGAAFVWAQGETDAENASYAAAYQSNLTAFVADMRALISFPTARFVIKELDPTLSHTYTAQVLAAQQAVAAAVSNVRTVTGVDFLIGSPDGIHGTAAKAREFGIAAADAIVAP
jgi:hypothetical protein